MYMNMHFTLYTCICIHTASGASPIPRRKALAHRARRQYRLGKEVPRCPTLDIFKHKPKCSNTYRIDTDISGAGRLKLPRPPLWICATYSFYC